MGEKKGARARERENTQERESTRARSGGGGCRLIQTHRKSDMTHMNEDTQVWSSETHMQCEMHEVETHLK